MTSFKTVFGTLLVLRFSGHQLNQQKGAADDGPGHGRRAAGVRNHGRAEARLPGEQAPTRQLRQHLHTRWGGHFYCCMFSGVLCKSVPRLLWTSLRSLDVRREMIRIFTACLFWGFSCKPWACSWGRTGSSSLVCVILKERFEPNLKKKSECSRFFWLIQFKGKARVASLPPTGHL